MVYTGRDRELSHAGMGIIESDWIIFIGPIEATRDHFGVSEVERPDVLGFIDSTKAEIVV